MVPQWLFLLALQGKVKNITLKLWGTNMLAPVDVRGDLIFTSEKRFSRAVNNVMFGGLKDSCL